MKLTNNLSTDQRFETYPYNILQKDFAESWNKDVIKVYKEAYNAGFDVHYVLLIVEEFCKTVARPTRKELLNFYCYVYRSCLTHTFSDPSHVVPVNLSDERRRHVYEGYRDGIDASVYANPTMPVAYMKNMKTALILLKNKDKWNEYTSKTLEVEFVDKD